MVEGSTPATVVEILGRSGVRGVVKAKCKVMDGHDAGRILIRNVMGPLKIGDILLLKETEMESSGDFARR